MANFSKWLGASRDDGPDSAAAEAVRTRLAAVEFYLPKAANDYNKSIEFVHQSRVWSRRSAAAIEVFEEFLPPQRMRRLQKALKQIRRACNDARDDDVFAVRLAADKQNKNARHLLEMVREHRKRSQQPIVQAHDKLIANGKLSRRTAKLIGRIRFRDETNGDHERPDFGQWSAGRLQSLVDEFFDAAREDFSEYANLHAFRIVGKKVRYALELLHGAFAVSVRETVYPAIEDLQERLG